MLVKLYGAAIVGIDAAVITIEVNITSGIKYYLVGLPDSAVKESEQRIQSAITHNGYRYPGQRIVINMSPADIRKEGSAYDLPIALGILAASGQIPENRLDKYLIMGELSLDGSILPIKGALPIAICAKEEGYEGVILPAENAGEAALVEGIKVLPAVSLRQVVDHFLGIKEIEVCESEAFEEGGDMMEELMADFSEVRGQQVAIRGLEIAAAGGHNILLVGSPGSGKSMMAKRLPSILPPLTMEEALETTKIHSVAGTTKGRTKLITVRPFRNPHHTISDVALVGGGSKPQPGEISLAHNGVLFLDELPEFKRNVLEVLRQPLEDRTIQISRSKYATDYPASFMLAASMNPCPCGYYGTPNRKCVCNENQVKKYLSKVSGPLLDRIDLHVFVDTVPVDKLTSYEPSEPSSAIRERVVRAREIQKNRFKGLPGIHCNAQMTPKLSAKYAVPDEQGMAFIKIAIDKFGLSARAYDRITKVARTIADLDGSEQILAHHITEAIQYRSLDRSNYGRK